MEIIGSNKHFISPCIVGKPSISLVQEFLKGISLKEVVPTAKKAKA
jgi:hypothetical protein